MKITQKVKWNIAADLPHKSGEIRSIREKHQSNSATIRDQPKIKSLKL